MNFNEIVMFNDSPSTYISNIFDLSVSDDEQQKVSVQVMHVEDKVAEKENYNNDVQRSRFVLQQTNNLSVVDRHR
jgi:hypothetical protein